MNGVGPFSAVQTVGGRKILTHVPGFSAGDIPVAGALEGWFGADLLIYGLEHAGHGGKLPTQAAFIKHLRTTTINCSANGLVAPVVNFTNFGTPHGFQRPLAHTSCR